MSKFYVLLFDYGAIKKIEEIEAKNIDEAYEIIDKKYLKQFLEIYTRDELIHLHNEIKKYL